MLAGACGPGPEPAVRTLPLDGGWRFRDAADSAWLPATVPGTVHTDLLNAGLIPDPLAGAREGDLGWIQERTWVYALDFDADPALLDEERVELVFDGLDTWATVSLNGVTVLEADNMFRRWRVDARPAVRAGANTLEVRLAPPVEEGAARARSHPWPIPHQEPDHAATRAFSRKAAYHFGWDWGPRYVTSGIWRPVRLEAWSGARIVDAHLAGLAWSGPDGDTARATVSVDVDVGARAQAVRVGVASPEGAFGPALTEVRPAGGPGRVTVDLEVVVPGARRWWPRGMGREPGHRYRLAVDVATGHRWDRRELLVGLRDVALVTEADSAGESFRFEVNGEPVFARGANMVPPDHFTPRADSARYARLVDDAVAAHMNMLRVWGGGVYLPDVFYDLADAAGLLVWQDFMFANTLVPGDDAFAASVGAEAEDQLRRLRHHASVVLWCGNNEVAEGWANWGWREAYTPAQAQAVEAAYRRIFHDVLPAAVERLAPGTPYVPSSPRLGWGDPESLRRGDSHYWGVWWGMEPFRVYAEKVPRFASEFGFQALPAPATLASFDDRSPGLPESLDAPVMRAHQKHPTGYETIRSYVSRDWPVPPADSVDAWSWVSQMAQAEGVGLALEAHRRAWPHTGGTLFWQLNDTWPVVSWSSVDVFGRWKALHHEARRIFAPVAVLADRWGDTLGVWVASDTAVSGTLSVEVVDGAGVGVARLQVPVVGSGPAWRGTRAELVPPGVDVGRVAVVAVLRDGSGRELARDRALFVPPVAMQLPDPGLAVVAAEEGADGVWQVDLTASGLAWGVRVDVQGAAARVTPDFVDIVPGDTVRLRVAPETPTRDLPARLRFRSLADAPGTRR